MVYSGESGVSNNLQHQPELLIVTNHAISPGLLVYTALPWCCGPIQSPRRRSSKLTGFVIFCKTFDHEGYISLRLLYRRLRAELEVCRTVVRVLFWP